MNQDNYKEKTKNVILETLKNELNRSRSCDLFFFKDKESKKAMLDQIMSKKDISLTKWEVLNIIKGAAFTIQIDNKTKYPNKDANDKHISDFAIAIADKVTCYLCADHNYTITLPFQGVTEDIKKFLNRREIPKGIFQFDKENESLLIELNGPLVNGGENVEIARLNSIIQAIFGVGILLDLFYINHLEKEKVLALDKAVINPRAEYFNIENAFSKEIKDLSEKISFCRGSNEDEAEKYLEILNKILNKGVYSSEILYSLSWYCHSLDCGEDNIRTKFICRYIGFEALAGIWSRSNKKDRSSQDRLKYTISALLSQNIEDIKLKEKQLKNVIDLRNELFHGNANEGKIEEFSRKMHLEYATLGDRYKDLFLYTLSKL